MDYIQAFGHDRPKLRFCDPDRGMAYRFPLKHLQHVNPHWDKTKGVNINLAQTSVGTIIPCSCHNGNTICSRNNIARITNCVTLPE